MRKAFAIFIILLANIILLAHVVIPHHHHDSIACFVAPLENEEHHDCDHHDTDKRHDAECEGDCCLLNDMLVIIPHGYKHEQLYWLISNEGSGLNFISLGNLSPELDPPSNPFVKAFKDPPYLFHKTSARPGSVYGLRAPPTC